jgi:hypothetical protein
MDADLETKWLVTKGSNLPFAAIALENTLFSPEP